MRVRKPVSGAGIRNINRNTKQLQDPPLQQDLRLHVPHPFITLLTMVILAHKQQC